jgi:hypothetical protein
VTPRSQTPDTLQLLQRTDSPMVGNAIAERKDVGAGDPRTSTRSHISIRPGSLGRTAGASIGEVAAITPLRSSDFDALATLPKSLRAQWQQRYGN